MTDHARTVRLKTYTAETGLVYQYYFVGKRRALAEAAQEYVFDVSSDRQVRFSVSILVFDAAVSAWAQTHGRSLAEAELYAAAKMRLLRGFDEIEAMFQTGRRLDVDHSALDDLLLSLGID